MCEDLSDLSSSFNGNDDELQEMTGKKFQGQCLRTVSPVSPARLYCCYAVIIVLTVAVIALSVALSLSDASNWTYSETSCMEQGAHLTQFDSLEELNFLLRYEGDSAAWIGLHRESSEQPWMWTDNTEYNNLVPTRGEGQHAYLSDRGISSGRNNIRRRWICSKPTSYALQCPGACVEIVSKQ